MPRLLLVPVTLLSLLVVPRTRAAEDGFDRAVTLYNSRHYSQARTVFESLNKVPGEDTRLDFYLGRLALWFDDDTTALLRLEAAARHAPDDASIQNALGDAYGMAAQRASLIHKYAWAKKCQAAYERAVQLAPRNIDFRLSLMAYYLEAPVIAGGGKEKALEQAERIQDIDPLLGRIAHATLYLAGHQADKAFEQFEPELRRQPDNFIVLYQIGRCAAITGERMDLGLAALHRCLKLQPPDGPGKPQYENVHFRLGNILEKKGDLDHARTEYQLASLDNPDFKPGKEVLKN